MFIQMTWTVSYQLSFSSFTHIFDMNLVLQKLDSVMLNSKVILEDNFECAFPGIEISLLFLKLMVTNCTTERSFSQMKHIKNSNRTTMRQERLESLSLLIIEADLLCKVNFEDLIKDFANKKCRSIFCCCWNIDNTGSCWKTQVLVFLFVLFPLYIEFNNFIAS